MWFPVTESCPMSSGSLMQFWTIGASGAYRAIAPVIGTGSPVTTGSPSAPVNILGVLRHDIKSTDADYATNGRLVEVEVPVENNVEWEVEIGDTHSIVAAEDLGVYADLYDACTITVSTSAKDVFRITKRVSSTKAIGVLNIGTSGFGSVGAA